MIAVDLQIGENKIDGLLCTSVKTAFDNTSNSLKYGSLNHAEVIRVLYWRRNFANDQVSIFFNTNRKEMLIANALQMVKSQENVDYFPEIHFLPRKFCEKLWFFKLHPICGTFNWRQIFSNDHMSHIVMTDWKEMLIANSLQMVKNQENIDYFPEIHFLPRKFCGKLWFFKLHPICRTFNWFF